MNNEISLEELEKELVSEVIEEELLFADFTDDEELTYWNTDCSDVDIIIDDCFEGPYEVWIPEDVWDGTDIGEFFEFDEEKITFHKIKQKTYRVPYV